MKIQVFILPLLLTASATAQLREPEIEKSRPNRVARFVSRPMQLTPAANSFATAATVATVPIWTSTDGTFGYQMIGASPMTAGAGTTSITTNVIPLILTFSDGTTFDPTVSSGCSATAPQSLVLSSPLFNNFTYTVGGVTVGNTQYEDFFQRANFWKYAGPAGVSPNYHTLLTASPMAAIKITVPAASGSTATAACGKLGEMDINWFDTFLQGTVFKQLASLGVVPSSLPLFVLSNVVMYQGTTSSCCILGYHSGFNNPNFSSAAQTYVVADFDTSGDFGTTKDLAPMSHEVGEWLDDPTGSNPTPSWGHVGQVSGCQTNLEVGDPLSGTDIAVTMTNGFTYHVQELAFKSWFYHDAPSSGVNGWYSSNGTFKAAAAGCETSTTTLTLRPTNISAGSSTTVKITVAPGSGFTGIPSGSVTLNASNSTTPLATYTLSSSAVNTTAILPAGSYTVTANYAGDLNFGPSSSAAVAVTVGSPNVTLSPISLTFASQVVGSSSTSQNVTVSNKGTAPLSITSVSLAGASPGDFSQTNNCATGLAVNASCTISVTFKPTATGARTASVSIADNATGSPQTVPLTGTGSAGSPAVSLSPTSLTFASTNVGVATTAQSVTVKNTGTAALTITSTTLTGTNSADFSETNTCGASLAAGATCTVSVTFKPTAAGARAASLSIADNATGSPQTVALTGTGVAATPKVTLSPTSVAFASTTVGVASAVSKVTLTNTGTGSLSITGVSLTGTNPGDFSQTNTCGTTVAANGTCTISVTFKPTAKGARKASLSVADNATGSPQTVALTGTGK